MKPLMYRLLALLAFSAFANQTNAACIDLTPEQIIRDDVLIIVNENSKSSPEVGDYYCEQRGINPENIAYVHVPVTNDVKLDQFISLRDQLIKFMQENTFPAGVTPTACDTTQGYTRYYCPESVEQLSQNSKIRYLVTTRGLPIRFMFTGSILDGNQMASIDNYLRFWLTNYFSEDTVFKVNFNDRAIDFGDGRGMRPVNLQKDREMIVGRIDGVDTESAKRLVDRAINAEKNGIFGKVYANKFGGDLIRKSLEEGAHWKKWTPFNNNSTEVVYDVGWKYIHGMFGEIQGLDEPAVRHTTTPECTSYDPATGQIPKQCVVAVNRGAAEVDDNPLITQDLPPGTAEGRIPSPDNALIHQGYFDTFSSIIDFDHLLNWRDSASCNKLCNQADPLKLAACKAASTDTYKEIDTRCVRVADGYMGYTFNSYPVGSMAAWPTGWFQSANNNPEKFDQTGSQQTHYWLPEVRNDEGEGPGDDFSLWYRDTDRNSSYACYNGTEDYLAPPGNQCVQERRVNINQIIEISERAINLANPQEITFNFKYRGINLNRNIRIFAELMIRESEYDDGTTTISANNQIIYAKVVNELSSPNDPSDGVSWGDASVTFTLDPAKHLHPNKLYDGIKIRIYSEKDNLFDGELAFDNFSVVEDDNGTKTNIPLVNPSFDDGYRQLSGGDSAVSFLSRLNGLAFWGNISHHEADGHSFERNPNETLIYFLRGLPLGDAVWFAEFHNAGILYGDPIYTPVAIHLDYLSAIDNRAPDDTFNTSTDSPLKLTGDTINGNGPNVTSTYSIDYCTGKDFFICDQDSSWSPIVGMQNLQGGQRNMPLGDWDISGLTEGNYVLRLSVTTSNSAKNLTQTLYDYYNISVYSQTTSVDFDNDGLSYQQEIAAGTDPWKSDTDDDGLPDEWEVTNGVDALTSSTISDSDGDGFTDYVEYLRATDPADEQSIPVVTTHQVDLINGIDDGQSPFKTIANAINVAQPGDTILLLPGEYDTADALAISFTKPVHLKGSPNQSSILKVAQFTAGSSGDVVHTVVISDLVILDSGFTSGLVITGNGNSNFWQFERNTFNVNFDIKNLTTIDFENNMAVEFKNNLFTNASGDALKVSEYSSAVLKNNTITGNNVGIRAEAGSNVQVINSIISGNTSADILGVPSSSVSYTLTDDASLAGTNGNISGDPQFVDPQNGDYHLKPSSPAIDAGDPQSDFSQEPVSPVGRINLGFYGNTAEATIAVPGSSSSSSGGNSGSGGGQISWLFLIWLSLFGLYRFRYKH